MSCVLDGVVMSGVLDGEVMSGVLDWGGDEWCFI
jgi:hypothetical protein